MPILSRALAVALITFGMHSPVFPDEVRGVGNSNEVGWRFEDPDGVSPLGGGARVFLKDTGDDSADCLTPTTSCHTLAHLNDLSFGTLRVTVSLNGGDTFGGGSGGVVYTSAFTTGHIATQSFGSGQGTITSGNSAACVSATDIMLVIITNIICVGGGNTSNSTPGIAIINSQAGNTRLDGPVISGVTVSGYGEDGIVVKGTSGSSGFSGTAILNNTIHDVTGNYNPTTGSIGISGCINIYGNKYGLTSFIGGTISGNRVFNCTGTSGSRNGLTGYGISLFEATNFAISNNVAHDFGTNNNQVVGPGGIIVGDGQQITVDFNEVYNGKTALKEGNGIYFTGGLFNSLMAFNWVHDNNGYGLHFATFTGGGGGGNNTATFNITQNNNAGSAAAATYCEVAFYFQEDATGPYNIINNTLVNEKGSAAICDGLVARGNTGTWSGTIANNILIVNSGAAIPIVRLNNPQSATFRGNDYYTYETGYRFTWNKSSYTSLAAWQAATGQEKLDGVNVGLTTNPQIYALGGGSINGGYIPAKLMAYNLQPSSPMIGAGLNLQKEFGIAPPSQDYFGTPVAVSSLPVGAAAGNSAPCTASTNNLNYNSLLCRQDPDSKGR